MQLLELAGRLLLLLFFLGPPAIVALSMLFAHRKKEFASAALLLAVATGLFFLFCAWLLGLFARAAGGMGSILAAFFLIGWCALCLLLGEANLLVAYLRHRRRR